MGGRLDFWAQKHENVHVSDPQEEIALDLGAAVGADAAASIQQLTLYIPDTDKRGRPVKDVQSWVRRATHLLAKMGGGYTIAPPAEGGWLSDTGEIIVDRPTIIYCYVNENFVEYLAELRAFLHDLGRKTKQGEVAFAFDGIFYRITQFDGVEK